MTTATLTVEVPVSDELLDQIGGIDAFTRRAVGMICRTPDHTTADYDRAMRTVPTFVSLTPGATVVGPMHSTVRAAYADDPPRRDEDAAVTYVWFTLRVLGIGEVATDTSTGRFP